MALLFQGGEDWNREFWKGQNMYGMDHFGYKQGLLSFFFVIEKYMPVKLKFHAYEIRITLA